MSFKALAIRFKLIAQSEGDCRCKKAVTRLRNISMWRDTCTIRSCLSCFWSWKRRSLRGISWGTIITSFWIRSRKVLWNRRTIVSRFQQLTLTRKSLNSSLSKMPAKVQKEGSKIFKNLPKLLSLRTWWMANKFSLKQRHWTSKSNLLNNHPLEERKMRGPFVLSSMRAVNNLSTINKGEDRLLLRWKAVMLKAAKMHSE